jgi:hypothetical protein
MFMVVSSNEEIPLSSFKRSSAAESVTGIFCAPLLL